MNLQLFRPWHETHQHLPALFRQSQAGPPRFSTRALESFDAPDALALAARDARSGQEQILHRLQNELNAARNAQGRPDPLALLLLDADAEPVMLLPLLLWRPTRQPGPAGLRAIVTLARPAAGPALSPPRRAGWQMTVLQARALLRTVLASLPDETDLFLCRAVPPGAAMNEKMVQRLLDQVDDAKVYTLPGCATVHPLGWRGMLALLQARLRMPLRYA